LHEIEKILVRVAGAKLTGNQATFPELKDATKTSRTPKQYRRGGRLPTPLERNL
jgi:hypothetical protein